MEKYIRTNIGKIPFESYEDMVDHGYGICIDEKDLTD